MLIKGFAKIVWPPLEARWVASVLKPPLDPSGCLLEVGVARSLVLLPCQA